MLVQKLSSLLSAREKRILALLIVLSIGISVIETVGVSAIMPFIAVATDFSVIHANAHYQAFYTFLNCGDDVTFVVMFGFALLAFYFARALANLLYFHLMSRFSQGRYHAIASRLFEKYLNFYYADFVKKNSSILTKTIVTEAFLLTSILSNTLLMVSELFVIAFLYALMLWTHWKVTLLFTAVLGIKVLLLTQTISKKIKAAGNRRVKAQKVLYELLGATFGNFKIIKLQGQQRSLRKEFEKASATYARANVMNVTMGSMPRIFLEFSGFSLVILIIAYVVWKHRGDVSYIIPTMSLFVLALYRLLPSVNRIMTAYNGILYQAKSLDLVSEDLLAPGETLGDAALTFNATIAVRGLSFAYDEQNPVLRDIDLVIEKNQKIAFKGESGAGKSTLVDLIIGLYTPNRGCIEIDGVALDETNLKSWRAKIGYIPQQVYLFDGTVAENVVFGREFDAQRLIETLQRANIYDFLLSKEGWDTRVGEGGIQLSGGQKQRIAIARALYGDPEVLVLDEATSALDNDTERKIMDEIYKVSEDKTLLIIAHRLSTIDRCQKVYALSDGSINRSASALSDI
ncbi:MAG: ATP-binding cassette domain-containing protein [Gammaproteobacteria bacterium]